MSKITAIIPSLVDVDKHYLKLCVESLRESGFDGDITVVMNGTRDLNPLHDIEIKGITKAIVTKQQGQCNAVNQGAKMVEGDCKYLFVINTDMYFAPGWNKNMPSVEEMPLCWSPNLIEPTNNPGSAKPFIKRDWGFTLDEFKKERADKGVRSILDFKAYKDKPETKPKQETGFNLPFFINVELWRTIGGYDTKYDPWGSNSDTDLQTAINLAGVTPSRLRDVLVYHFSNKSGTFDGSHQAEWQKNWDYFDQKWGFNRDILGSDVWYNKDMLPKNLDDSKYQPEWMGKYLEA
jgi:GT2 family glycosyltransferase